MSELIQENQQTANHVIFNQEFRLGLVVYGGVSLAVYMNGICREFYNAVRGRGVYKLLKALTDSDIIVDVLSGTSAGGINGILLSYALTNSTKEEVFDFKNFANVWRESGNISQLLRPASEPPRRSQASQSGETVDSVLDGKQYYQNQLANAFQTVWKNKAAAPVGEWFSESSELDLFITGTDLLGKVYKAFDNTGSLIEVKEHRTVFHLKYRQGRKQPFQPAENQIPQKALAKLCRITSCFPVAFPVVSVQLQPEVTSLDPEDAIDRYLVAWGQLDNRELPATPPPQGYQLHFVDGGVLDNRPFSYTINEIYRRTAYRPARRKMFYIDPSPDRFLDSPQFRRMERPTILQAATDSLVGMPRYESIANDLKEINDRNEKVRRYKFLRATAQRAVEGDQPLDNSNENSQKVYLRCRLVGLRDRILPLILRIDQLDQPNNPGHQHNQDKLTLLGKTAELMTKYLAKQEDRDAREDFLNQLSDEIRNLDVDYALRKHFFLLEKVCEQMSQPQDSKERQNLATLAGNIGLQVQLLEVIQAGIEQFLQMQSVSQVFYDLIEQADKHPEHQKQIYDYLLRLHRFILDNDLEADGLPHLSSTQADREAIAANFFDTFDPSRTEFQREGILNRLREKAERLAKLFAADDRLGNQPDSASSQYFWKNDRYTFVKGSENNSPNYCSFLVKIEQASEKLIQDVQHSESERLLNLFQRFRDIDQAVYSFEYLSDIQAKEQLEIIRISPNDAQKGFGKDKGLDDKLAGDQLRAFGGFFKKSWRSNDILWGRLDGVNRIVDALLTPEALAHFPEFLQRQIEFLEGETVPGQTIAPQDYLTALIAETLPHATPAEKQMMLTSLLKLTDATTLPTAQELKELAESLQELLVLAEHRAIVRAELGNVLEDSIDEQLQWNQQQLRPTKQGSKIPNDLKYQPVSVKNLAGEQLEAVNQLNHLIKHLVDPKLLSGAASLLVPPVADKKARKERVPAIEQEQYLQHLMQTAFPHMSEGDRRKLSIYPLAIAQSTHPAIPNVDDLYRFLSQLLAVTKQELTYPPANAAFTQAIQGINQQLQKMIDQLKPTYQPVNGYFDRAITPFVATELARASTQAMLQEGREEDYFRNQYRVGSESLTDSIPPLILQNLAAQAGVVLRNVLATSAVGDRVQSTWTYQIFNTVLRLFYWSVRSRNAKFRLGGSSFSTILELLGLVAIAAITVVVISNIPYWLMVILLSIPTLWLIFAVWRFLTKR